MALPKQFTPEILTAIGIVVFYTVIRLYNIDKLPIFTDEAIYIRWAQYLQSDIKFWDYSMTDGKQPLFIWFMTLFMYTVGDPLLAGRLVSVVAGFVTMIGLFVLGRELFKNRWIGLLSSAVYAVYPFALVYDRMALYDSLVGTFAVWGLYLVILLVRYIRFDFALLLGIIAGLSALNKSNGFFTILLLPFSAIMFNVKQKRRNIRFLQWLGLSFLATVMGYGFYSLLRLSPYFHIIDQKNIVFIYPFSEWVKHPFEFFWGNLWIGQRDWFIKYFGYSFIIASITAFVIKKQFLKEKILLTVWFLIPFLILALFGRTIYPRYILFMTLSLLPLVAYSLYYLYSAIKNKYLFAVVCLFVFLLPLRADYLILTGFAHAPLPISDLAQYNNDWPAGIGIKESIRYLKEKEKGKNLVLYTQGTFGLLPYAYEIYLHDDPQFTIKGIWPIDLNPPQELIDSAKKMPTYIVFYQPCVNCLGKGRAPATWPLRVALEVKKPAPDAWLTLYKVREQ